jgi:hypothetical protein
MNNTRSSKLSLFLMELIIAIFFFSLSAAICVRLFASAHTLSENTETLENAIMWTQNLSEAFVSERGELNGIARLFPDGYVSKDSSGDSDRNGSIILIFDEDWELMDSGLTGASYEVIMVTAEKDASEVYSDVNTYGVDLVGKAVTGDIAVYDLRGKDGAITTISDNEDDAFYSLKTDVYIGEED